MSELTDYDIAVFKDRIRALEQENSRLKVQLEVAKINHEAAHHHRLAAEGREQQVVKQLEAAERLMEKVMSEVDETDYGEGELKNGSFEMLTDYFRAKEVTYTCLCGQVH